jgi:hypothetical protein
MGPGGPGNCKDAAERMANGEEDSTTKGTAAVDSLDSNDDQYASRETSDAALDKLKTQIEEDGAAVIGVNRVGDPNMPNAPYGDNATNHFVTAYQVNENPDGSVDIYYRDPGTSNPANSMGVLHRDPGDTMFTGQRPYSTPTGGQPDYEMTTVRENKP